MIPPALAAELRPLVLLLSSNQPGEVFAASQRIGRKLGEAGLDWYALADVLDTPATRPKRCQHSVCPDGWCELVAHIAARAAELSERDRVFAESMAAILRRGWTPTDKQAAWLRSLYERTGGQWAEAA